MTQRPSITGHVARGAQGSLEQNGLTRSYPGDSESEQLAGWSEARRENQRLLLLEQECGVSFRGRRDMEGRRGWQPSAGSETATETPRDARGHILAHAATDWAGAGGGLEHRDRSDQTEEPERDSDARGSCC